jgi:hypothetical protein
MHYCCVSKRSETSRFHTDNGQQEAKCFASIPTTHIYVICRYNNIPYEERICSHCDLNEVGNEQHYLMQCANTKFSVIRTNFITNLFRINYSFRFFNNHDLFIYIMSMKDKSINSLVAKFCYYILKIFDLL